MDKIIKKTNNLKPQDNVVKDIVNIINTAQAGALRVVNTYLVIRNLLIGKRIDEEILTTRSNDYGKGLIKNLSIELSKYGKGFKKTDLYRYLTFFRLYPNIFYTVCEKSQNKSRQNIVDTVCPESQNYESGNIFPTLCGKSLLPWTYYRLLIKIKDKNERDWYVNRP